MNNTSNKTIKNTKVEDTIKYQRAKYRLHEVDDPALREHFQKIISDYERKYLRPTHIQVPMIKEFDGRGLA